MRKFLAVALVVFASAAGSQTAHAGELLANRLPGLRAVAISPREPGPAVTRLHPVVGSVQRTGHFTNPITHKAKHSVLMYNPTAGTFGTHTFRR